MTTVTKSKFPAHDLIVKMMASNLAENTANPDAIDAADRAKRAALEGNPKADVQGRVEKIAEKLDGPAL